MLAIMSLSAIATPAVSSPRNVLTLPNPENQTGPTRRMPSVVAV